MNLNLKQRTTKYIDIFQRQGFIAGMSELFCNTSNKLSICAAKLLLRQKPLENTIVIESQTDFDANSGAFYDFLIKNHYNQKYRIIWLIKNNKPDHLPQNVFCFNIKKPNIRKAYYLCTAKYYILDLYLLKKIRADQISIYLTHGPFALKAVKGKTVLPEDLNYYLIPSETTAPLQAEQLMQSFPDDKQLILGFPKHDVFYSDQLGDLHKLTNRKYKKVILWMPTFRKAVIRNDSNAEQPLGIPIFKDMAELEEINNIFCQNNSLLIIKIHPAQDLSSTRVCSMSNIKVLNGVTVKTYGIDVNRLMKDTDALISDYSSAAYDYLHVDKPLAYTFDDIKDYKLGLKVENPSEWMAGPVIYNVKEYIDFIYSVFNGEDSYRKKRQALFDKVFKYHDGNSSKRLAEFLGISIYEET